MSLPALHALRAAYPAAHIAIQARPWVADLYAREPFCDQVIPHTAQRGWRDYAGKLQLAREIRRQGFDMAILLQNAFEAAAIALAAGIPRRVGYDRDGRGFMLTDAVQVPRDGDITKHERFYYLELLKRAKIIAGYDEDVVIRLTGADSAKAAGRAKLDQWRVAGPVVGVSPGAAYGGAKRWLPERFAESAVALAQELKGSVMLFGSGEERALAEQVEALIRATGTDVKNVAGETSLREFIDLAAASTVFLSNDSGPMHIASALGVPLVTVFGATNEVTTGPTGPLARVVREPVDCAPCLLRECPIDHRCMTRVTSERVVSTALELLK